MTIFFWTLIITVIAAFLIIVLERLFPYNRQKFLRKGIFNDLVFYTGVQNYILGLVIFGFLHFIDNWTHFSKAGLISHWNIYVQVAFFVVTHDFYIYWFHRWQHHNVYLWRIHEAHHTNEDIDWLAGSRSHPLEILINQTIEYAPIILLGAAPEVALYKGMISAVWGMYIHSNINVRVRFLQYFINGPQMHRWHHSANPEEGNHNFSTKLAIWDWLFGTAYFPKETKAQKYGLDYLKFPKNYFKQIIFAFRGFDEDEDDLDSASK